jgi:DNA (cytosine-5)-methyltransferase 1
MSEIAALPWNGFKVVSTFSGCGGSCTGYRMAGFRVVWASEFIPAAQASYKANAAPDCILDNRDIRTVKADEILAATGLKRGELDLFDGSPPCASFSTAGKREAGWGKVKAYSDTKQRTDDLFNEYVRILNGLQPKVFVAENVSGLVKGTAKGMFLQILAALKGCGYRVTCRVLDAQWLGVPQQRQRTIFVGVRNDLNLEPVHPSPLPYRYSVRDALPWITDITGRTGPQFKRVPSELERPMNAVLTSDPEQTRYEVEAETDISRYAIGKEWERMGKPGTQSDKYFQLVRPALGEPRGTITQRGGDNTVASVCHPTEKRKFTIAELRRICAFPDDFILCGSYAQQWERLGRSVPPVMMASVASAIRDGILSKCR